MVSKVGAEPVRASSRGSGGVGSSWAVRWTHWTFLIGSGELLFWVVACFVYLSQRPENGAVLAVALLSMAIAGCVALVLLNGAARSFPKPFPIATFVMVVIQSIFLIGYSLMGSLSSSVLIKAAWLSVGFAVAIVLGALWLASEFICASRGDGAVRVRAVQDLVGSLRRHPFVSISFFLSGFCLVASHVAFAFALHDQAVRARWREAPEIQADEAGDGELSRAAPPIVDLHATVFPGTVTARRPPENVVREPYGGRLWKLQFVSGEVAIREEKQSPLGASRPLIERSLSAEEQIGQANDATLAEIVEAIGKLAGHARLTVLVVGHANDVPVKSDGSAYSSNFEVSKARVDQVRLSLIERLDRTGGAWCDNVEWLVVPLSNEERFLDPELTVTEDKVRLLTVEVALLPSTVLDGETAHPAAGRPLGLLDYLYFTIYTITTTGYGDIMPASSFAKFLAALANLFEVIFIVVFFNVLISLLGGRSGGFPVGGERVHEPARAP